MAELEYKVRFEVKKLEGAAYLLKAVVYPTRLAVIDWLDQYKEMCVTDFSKVLALSRAIISHHLTDMRSEMFFKQEEMGSKFFTLYKEKSVLGLLKCIQNCKHE